MIAFKLIFFVGLLAISNGQIPSHKLMRSTADEIDTDALFHALTVPTCIQKCINGLVHEVKEVLKFKGVFKSIEFLEYNSASECMERNSCPHLDILDVVTSGIKSLCIGKKQTFLRNNAQCIEANIDNSAQSCDRACNFVQSIADFTDNLHGKVGYARVLKDVGPVCFTAQCFLPCFRDSLNAKCSKAGGIFVDVILKPFYFLSEYIEIGGDAVKRFVAEKLPNTCQYLTKKSSLDAIRKQDGTESAL
ncbi:chondroitin proteoglycan 4 domain-containing protein [Ditylenchus destructor]|uniref:Chondroitin proteoglycan 4 domain-containing protein n=1 Tax=Ditylenchus destructor TaxID=166010 RepID=A0AAD4MR38_9BILA|nr:chondroitin proteoglycan 4 domain-containing protein [Ditylenchus destructor]